MPKLDTDIFLIAALRTPIGKFGGALASMTAPQLGVASAKATIERSGIDTQAIDEVIFGNARQAGVGPNAARQIAIKSGLRHEVPAYTVNQACGSGLRAIMNAADQIRLGHAQVVLAGGTESMSNTPYLLMRARWGTKMGDGEVVDGMYRDGFMCPLADEMMGATAETLAERYRISRQEQDQFAVESQKKTERAYAKNRFDDEIVPLENLQRDEHPRFDTDLGSLAKLPPVFRKDGSVHAGNSSGVTDGASSMLVASGDALKKHGLEPMARIIGYAQAGVDPKIMGIGPVPATRESLKKAEEHRHKRNQTPTTPNNTGIHCRPGPIRESSHPCHKAARKKPEVMVSERNWPGNAVKRVKRMDAIMVDGVGNGGAN